MKRELVAGFIVGFLASGSPAYAESKVAKKGQEPSGSERGPGKSRLAAWNAFNKSKKWKIEWDRRTGTPHHIGGYHSRIAEPLNYKNAGRLTGRILAEHEELFGVERSELRFFKADFVAGSSGDKAGTWYVYYRQLYKKLRVVGGSLRFVIKNQEITSISADLHPGIQVRSTGTIDRDAAIRIAGDASGLGGRLTPEKMELLVLPRYSGDTVRYHLAWRILWPAVRVPQEESEPAGGHDARKSSAASPAQWQFLVDAETGQVLDRRNLILEETVSGTVTGMAYVPSPLGPQRVVPLSRLTVTTRQDPSAFSAATDGAGSYRFDQVTAGTATVDARLAGPNVVVTNAEASAASHTAAVNCPGTHDWNWQADDTSPQDVETNAFYHVNFIHDWFSRGGPFNVVPAGRDGSTHVEAVVRLPGLCNAFAAPGAGLIEFGAGTVGCMDLGLCSQVIYHEYGHLVFQQIYDDAGAAILTDDGDAMHEAFADYFGESITNDPINANGCGGDHRNSDTPDLRIPEDYGSESHYNGRIMAGAVWDLRKVLGADSTDSLAIRALKHGETTFTDYLGALIEEDDDPAFSVGGNNDLSDSSPHIAAICESFYSQHGIYHRYCAGHTSIPVAVIRDPSPLKTSFNVFDGASTTITINGTAHGSLGRPLTTYALEYSDERDPLTWSPIYSGTTAVSEGVLGGWDIRAVKDGYYFVRLTVTDAAGNSRATVTTAVIDRARKNGWPQHTNEFFPTPPVTADFDPGYAGLEIAARERWGRLYLWHADGTIVPGWPRWIGDWPLSAPAVFEKQGDFRIAVAATDSGNTTVYALNKTGAAAGWPQICPGEIDDRVGPVTGDFDDDGRMEVAIGTSSRICVWDADGAVKPGWPFTPGAAVTTALAAGDIDGDGAAEIVAGTDTGTIYAIAVNGTMKSGWGVQKFAERAAASPVLADFNGDGRMETAIGTASGKIYLFAADGALLSGWPQAVSGQVNLGLSAADVNADGKPELIIQAEGTISVRDHQGNIINTAANACGTGGQFQMPAAVADVVPAIAVEMIATSNLCFDRGVTKVSAFDGSGSAVTDWSRYSLSPYGRSAPVIADVDNDQEGELLTNGFGINVWELPGSNARAFDWPEYRHDAKRSACRPLPVPASDQTDTTGATGLSMGCGVPPMGLASLFQGFTPSRTSLVGVDLRLRAGGKFPAAGYSTVVNIRKGTPDGMILGTATALVSGPIATGQVINVSFDFPTNVKLVPGEVYVIEWRTPPEGDSILTWMASTSNAYPGGTAYGCQGSSIPDKDFLFTTYSHRRSCP